MKLNVGDVIELKGKRSTELGIVLTVHTSCRNNIEVEPYYTLKIYGRQAIYSFTSSMPAFTNCKKIGTKYDYPELFL